MVYGEINLKEHSRVASQTPELVGPRKVNIDNQEPNRNSHFGDPNSTGEDARTSND